MENFRDFSAIRVHSFSLAEPLEALKHMLEHQVMRNSRAWHQDCVTTKKMAVEHPVEKYLYLKRGPEVLP